MSVVLVTGGGGFIGRHCTEALLSQGHDVHIAQRSDPNIKGTIFHGADLSQKNVNESLIKSVKPDGLVHLAWTTAHGKFWHDPANEEWLNSSKALIDSFLQEGGTRAVFAGSCAEYDWNNQGALEPYKETARLAPNTPYGQAKRDLWQYLDHHINQGASIAWGRLFFLYGPFETKSRLVASLIRSLLNSEVAKMSPGTQIRDFMHCEDAGRAFAETFTKSDVTGAVNIASGDTYSLYDIAEKIQKLIRQGELDNQAFEMRPDDPSSLVANVARLYEDVGFESKFSIDSGLEATINWWRQEMLETK